jgi:hypothetical protein
MNPKHSSFPTCTTVLPLTLTWASDTFLQAIHILILGVNFSLHCVRLAYWAAQVQQRQTRVAGHCRFLISPPHLQGGRWAACPAGLRLPF